MLRSPFFLAHFAAKGIVEDFGPAKMVQYVGERNGYFQNIFSPAHPAVDGLLHHLNIKFRSHLNQHPGGLFIRSPQGFIDSVGSAAFRHFELPFYLIAGSIWAFAARNPQHRQQAHPFPTRRQKQGNGNVLPAFELAVGFVHVHEAAIYSLK